MERVPDRPVWLSVYKGTAQTPTWKDQELVSVTRETLRLSLNALQALMAQDYYHNYGAAAHEITEVLAAHSPHERGPR